MGTALYVVLQMALQTSDVDGKALAHCCERLDSVAEELGVKPLSEFFSVSRELALEFGVDTSVDIEEKWFNPSDGLDTCRQLLSEIKRLDIEDKDQVCLDLKNMISILEEARSYGIGWHLAYDF